MRLFECQFCKQPLMFENTVCERCGHRLGFLSEAARLHALEPQGTEWRLVNAPGDTSLYRFCANAAHGLCNWLVTAQSGDTFCAACRHNRTIPDLSDPTNLPRWARLEQAKHRLIYTLMRLRLPLATRIDDPQEGLAFDFMADNPGGKTLTGHEHGVITLNLAEADDDERERRRHNMGEPYRTLLGHFRHEVGHYYWDRLVRDTPRALAEYRAMFGDERADYGAALKAHYDNGPPADWRDRFVSSYATMHPWEDFAETFAHYLHIVDTLEMAHDLGLAVNPRIDRSEDLSTTVDFLPYRSGSIGRLIEAWVPLTFAVNSLNRSMGQPDLYPFVLPPPAIAKLGFVHELVRGGFASQATAEQAPPLQPTAA